MDSKIIAALLIAVALFFGGYRYAASIYTAEIAELRQHAAEDVARFSENARAAESRMEEIKNELEAVYLGLADERAERGLETVRLERDLSDALVQLRSSAVGGGSSLPKTTGDAGSCADVRASRDRLANALERIVEGGGAIVADGQKGVDTATIAARAAREYQK